MSVAQQYADLVTRLYNKTKAGELWWDINSWESAPSTQLAHHSIKIFICYLFWNDAGALYNG